MSQVNDKSGNANHITQGTAASKPGTGAQTLNGLNVLTFDGGDVLTKTSSALAPDVAACMLFSLRLVTSGTSGGLVWTFRTAGPSGDICVLGRDIGNMGAWGNDISSSATMAATYADSDNTNWHLSGGLYTLASRTIYEDGVSKATNNTSTTNHTPDQIFIGETLSRDRASTRFLTGRMAQALIVAGTTQSVREKIEGWAMWKYRLQSQLASTHPYKNVPPVV